MKKFHRSIALFLSLTVVTSMFFASACSKNDPDGSASLNTTSATSSAATEISTSDSTGGTGETSASQGTDDAGETGDISGASEPSDTSGPSTAASAAHSETTSPDDGSASGVKVHWDSYESAEVEGNVYTRLSESVMTDFIPSDKYGELIPYYARNMLTIGWDTYFEGTTPVGFFNEEGVLICDPIFDTCLTLPNGDYLVGRYRDARAQLLFDEVEEDAYEDSNTSEEEDEAHYARRYYLYRYGILSHDGSSYTGLIYDGYSDHFNNPNSDTIYLYSFKDKTTQVTPYLFSERKSEDPFELAFTPSPYSTLTRLDSQTVVFTYSSGYFNADDTLHLDGSHPDLGFPEMSSMLGLVFGNSYLFHSDEEEMRSDETFWKVYSFKDQKRLPHGYSTFSHITADQMLMVRADGYDVVDGDGHIVATLDNSDHKWTRVSSYGGYFIGLKEDALVIMDEAFKEIKTIANCSMPCFVLQTGMNTDPEESRFYGESGIHAGIPLQGLEPIIRYTSSGSEYLYNIKTGATYDCGKYDIFYQYAPGYIICHKATPADSDVDYNPWDPIGAYAILDSKDMHFIYQSENLNQILQDSVTGKTYLFQYRRNEKSGLHSSLIDLQTGKSIWEKKDESSTPVTVLPCQIVNGQFCYEVYSYEYELSGEDGCYTVSDLNATVLQDENGQVLFRYKAMHQNDD